ncbi:MAG: RcnB family protein [Comamonas sp.]|jgi:Ni/Co efflux regulator RcnB|nr:RcnB family protein [Comamonas sp.]
MTSRWTTRILSASIAACMGLGSLAAYAQPGPPPGHGQNDMRHGGRHDDRGRNDHRNDRGHDSRYDRHDGYRGAGPNHNWVRGSRVPPQYRGYNYVVNDWRGHRLSAPPRGYHWIQNGNDYLLVAIATGVIASLVLGNY